MPPPKDISGQLPAVFEFLYRIQVKAIIFLFI